MHEHFGPDYAVLAGAIATYSVKGSPRTWLGLPKEDLKLLSKQIHSHDAAKLKEEMLDARGWRDLIELAPQLMDAPRSLGQHVGGMILSDSPISGMVPIREGAVEGRYIMDWNKDSVADANFAKIDLLSLPVLDQLEEALDLIEKKEGRRPDLSRIDPEDPGVYDMINAGRSKGVFLLQSPAQLKMGQCLKSRSLLDLAYRHDIGTHDDPQPTAAPASVPTAESVPSEEDSVDGEFPLWAILAIVAGIIAAALLVAWMIHKRRQT